MAAKEIAISTENLGKDIERLRNILKELQQNKKKMTEEIGELNTMWKGPANDTFVKQFQSDGMSFDNLCKTIEEMIRAMEHAKLEYEKCESKVNSLVRAIRI